MNPVYLDCNATTPLEPALGELLLRLMAEEYGNAGSRTHALGARAKQVVECAREQVAELVSARRDEVIFTSGATESNNLAVLGLREAAEQRGRRHLLTTAIEHKAVLEPMERLEGAGFEVTRLAVGASGAVTPAALREALRPETWLVSIMHVNNETGIRQPLSELARIMDGHPAYLHTDAAQGFGKDLDTLRDPRLDLISISGHKLFAPKGIGALVVRRRGYDRPPLQPLMVGGGQERGLRPGTLPVPLIGVLGAAAELATRDHAQRVAACRGLRAQALAALMPLGPTLIGDQALVMDHVLSLAFPGLDSEALMLGLKDLIAISNGSACTSSSYTPSHVLSAMGLDEATAQGAVRISWCHLTPAVDWPAVAARIRELV
jgi:cysteine desulfurase